VTIVVTVIAVGHMSTAVTFRCDLAGSIEGAASRKTGNCTSS